MHPGQSRRIRHERHRATGAPLTVTRHGRRIGAIVFSRLMGWQAYSEHPGIGHGAYSDPVRAEMALVDHAKANES